MVTNVLASRVNRIGHKSLSNNNMHYYRDKMEYQTLQCICMCMRTHVYVSVYTCFRNLLLLFTSLSKSIEINESLGFKLSYFSSLLSVAQYRHHYFSTSIVILFVMPETTTAQRLNTIYIHINH